MRHHVFWGAASAGFAVTLIAGLGFLASFADTAMAQNMPSGSKTGEATVTFANPSPLTDRAQVADRFGIDAKGDKTDYDLSKESFWVYVPAAYSRKKPAGIVVFEQTDGYAKPLPKMESACDARNVILLTNLDANLSGYKPAMIVDAVESLKKTYVVDSDRIYVAGLDPHVLWAQRIDALDAPPADPKKPIVILPAEQPGSPSTN